MIMDKKRIGILTGGGDVPGLNAVIKTVTYRSVALAVCAVVFLLLVAMHFLFPEITDKGFRAAGSLLEWVAGAAGTPGRASGMSAQQANLDTVANTWMRAPGESIGTFALESALDEMAYALEVDPMQLRLRNEPASDPEKHLPWSSRSLRQCYESAAATFGWSRRSAALTGSPSYF